MGPKILARLEQALAELNQGNTVRIEEDEVFFWDDEVRNREYTIAAYLFPRTIPKPRSPYRYRRWWLPRDQYSKLSTLLGEVLV